MYINIKELVSLEFAADKLQVILSRQTVSQNRDFDEGLQLAQEMIDDAYMSIASVLEREVKKRAKKISKE